MRCSNFAILLHQFHHVYRNESINHLAINLQLTIDRSQTTFTHSDSLNFSQSNLSNITSLHLVKCRLNDEAVKIMFTNKTLTNLTSLDINTNKFTAEGVKSIVNCPGLTNLIHLSLEKTKLGDESAQVISESSNLSSLKQLELAENRITIVGADYIINSKYLSNITYLDVSDNKIGTGGPLSKLYKRFYDKMKNLKTLHVEISFFEDSDSETDYYIRD